MNNLTALDSNTFLPLAETKANKAAVAKVVNKLPILSAQAKVFGRSNSQSMLTMMTLTMMNGHSPMRILRQILAEVENKKRALAAAQVSHAKQIKVVSDLQFIKNPTDIEVAQLREALLCLEDIENNVNGCFKDVAILIDAYEQLEKKLDIESWDETTFEAEEKRHHIRRGFELLYRNIIQMGRATETPIEYLMQYGVHVQQAQIEILGYVEYSNQRIANGEMLTSNDCENFLDQMADKYLHCADEATERLFGVKEITNTDYMLQLGKEK